MRLLEYASSSPTHDGYFVDLFVRCNNERAIAMYEAMGYTVYRRVVGYYSGMGGGKDGEDAFGESDAGLFGLSELEADYRGNQTCENR